MKGEDYETDGVTIISGGFLANHSVKLEKEKGQMTTDISGTKLLESLPKQNQNGLLEKMLTDLLASKTAWYSDKCKMTWRKGFQVQCLVIPASSIGAWHQRKESGSLDTMYPTPSASCQMDVVAPPNTVKQNKSGWSVTRLKNWNKVRSKTERCGKQATTRGGMYPTPMARDYKDMGFKPTWKWRRDKSVPSVALKDNVHGGKLNAQFMEFLMGYPTNWTKIEPIE